MPGTKSFCRLDGPLGKDLQTRPCPTLSSSPASPRRREPGAPADPAWGHRSLIPEMGRAGQDGGGGVTGWGLDGLRQRRQAALLLGGWGAWHRVTVRPRGHSVGRPRVPGPVPGCSISRQHVKTNRETAEWVNQMLQFINMPQKPSHWRLRVVSETYGPGPQLQVPHRLHRAADFTCFPKPAASSCVEDGSR